MRFLMRPELSDALDAAAAALELEARRLRRRAEAARKSLQAASDARQKATRARRLAKAILAAGAPLGSATGALEAELSLPRPVAIHYVTHARRAVEIDTREKRNQEIMRRKRRGQSDAEIGFAMDLHPKSVNRIAKTMRDKTSS